MIETDRLLLRDVLASDADTLLGYMREPGYWRHVPGDPPDRASVGRLVARCLREQAEDPRTGYFLAAALRASGEVVGEAVLRVGSRHHGAGEVGWGVAARHTGRGLATEIGRAMLGFGFDGLGLHRLCARCRVENAASRRVMAKLGMREEGVLREDVLARGGERWSSVLGAVLRADPR